MIFLYFFRWILVAVSSVLLTSCGLTHFDAPSVTADMQWVKSGYNVNKIWQELVACGYDPKAWSIEQQVKVDECMLSGGFVFIDSPYGQQSSICKFQYNKNLPSCKSLKRSN